MHYSAINWKTGKLLIIFFFLIQETKAQYYEIVHDMQKDTTIFYKTSLNKNNKSKTRVSISKIRSRKPSDIHLSVENINPFTWEAKITPVKITVSDESGSPGLFFTNMIASVGGNGLSGFAGKRDDDSKEEVVKKSILESKYFYLRQYKIELDELKYDKLKSEVAIKSKAEEIKTRVAEITGIDLVGKDNIDFNSAMRMSGSKLDMETATLGISLKEGRTAFSDFHMSIMKTYSEIRTAKFVINKNYNKSQIDSIEGFTLEISSLDTADNAQAKPIIRYFPLRSRANLKIRNSTGITFTYFKDNNRSYFVNADTTIGVGNNDLFTPVLSTFINFYSNRVYGFKWGGSLGIGMPIFQNEAKKNYMNFMLGLCTVLGRNDPIAISVGVAGTKVNRLSNRWKVGETVPTIDFDIPTQSQFRVGGFVSLSFNIANLSKKAAD